MSTLAFFRRLTRQTTAALAVALGAAAFVPATAAAAPRLLPIDPTLSYAVTDAEVPREWLTLPALILDLRETAPVAAHLDELVATRAAARRATFLLVGEDAPQELRVLAAAVRSQPATLVVGPLALKAYVDVTVPVSLTDDRRARAALTTATDLTTLINERVDKTRFDEAALVESRQPGAPASGRRTAEPPLAEPATPPASPTLAPTTPPSGNAAAPAAKEALAAAPSEAPPVIRDQLLLRAVHLYRGLRALGRLP